MTLSIEGWTGSARFSACQTYRYELSREWTDGEGSVLFVMLNPSIASAGANDPTIRRCIGFARGWGHRRLDIRNLFAFRATYPKDMEGALSRGVDIIGPDNNDSIVYAAQNAARVIVAWGAHKLAEARGRHVCRTILGHLPLFCLGRDKAGIPTAKHPLYLPANAEPIDYRSRP